MFRRRLEANRYIQEVYTSIQSKINNYQEMNNLTIPLVNSTGLSTTDYTIYILGFSSTSQKCLTVTTGSTVASFQDFPNTSGTVPSFKLGTEITSIAIDATPSNTDPTKPANSVDGARIYFFIAENSVFPTAPQIKYDGSGANIVNVKNPPNTDVPPYTFVEFTLVDLTYGAVIDSQTVDGFVFPVAIGLNDALGSVGQPSTVNREDVINAYAPFITALGDEGKPFSDLQYTENKGGLLNPGAYLGETTDAGDFTNLDSSLNSLFDDDLNTFFSSQYNGLTIQGVSAGSINADTYTATSGSQSLPGGKFTQPVLQFTGQTNGKTFDVFNPVGISVLNYNNNGTNSPITGTILNYTLTFTNPLPADTPLVAGMYVQGAGTNPNTTIKAINTNGSDEITSITFETDLLNPAPNSQYRFSKVQNMFYTSGNMVLANQGVFAYAEGLNDDDATILKNLQNQIVSAFNRGVALLSSTEIGNASKYWGTETNWYPEGKTQNIFSLFMHTATTANNTPIFLQASNSDECARGTVMGQAYGFAYDENPGPVPPAPTGQPEVPSKFDPLPDTTTTITITLGSWGSSS